MLGSVCTAFPKCLQVFSNCGKVAVVLETEGMDPTPTAMCLEMVLLVLQMTCRLADKTVP